MVVLLAAGAQAQGFSSGSTGADGAFAPTQNATVPIPASGVFNFTTVNIPSGVTITYVRNAANTPLTILAAGDVNISGSIVLDGQPGSSAGFGGLGGPGAGTGGQGGINVNASGMPGAGTGGGGGGVGFVYGGSPLCTGGAGGGFQTAAPGVFNGVYGASGGAAYGSSVLTPLLAGSGGGGGGAISAITSAGGGGGAGAILIASSTQIVFPASGPAGVISAQGGTGGNGGSGCSGGGGSGGAIHLVANTVSGLAQFKVSGGNSGCPGDATGCHNSFGSGGGSGGQGYVRVDALYLSGFNPTSSYAITSGLPALPSAGSIPSLQIVSIAGVAAPASPNGSFAGTPDVVLPPNQSNPVTVVVNAVNIPGGTTVTVTAVPASGTTASGSATLSGTTASSTANVSLTLPATLSVLTATTTTLIAASNPIFMNGEHVDKIEVAASFGGRSQLTYVTHSGRRIPVTR
jgi:hypothetical protein